VAVRVQQEPFQIGTEVESFSAQAANIGAIVTFTGVVRDVAAGMQHMLIEHYPAMTQSAIEDIEAQAVTRWDLGASLIIHRHGKLTPGEAIMMVATAAPHRSAAFSAAEFLMDYLKSRAPFWKQEVSASGAKWVAAKSEDEAALDRWKT
jgi:molybdopterin synthase catalytic subunit